MKKPDIVNLSNAICESIENKILERGLFTKYLGNNFQLEIATSLVIERLRIQINISTTKKGLAHDAIVEMTNYVHVKFFELAIEELSKAQFKSVEKKWFETVLVRDEKVIFGIDD